MIKKIPHIKRSVYEFIKRYMESNHVAPTIAEIRKQFDFRSPASVHQILVKLEHEGLIKRTPNISRGIEIARQSATPMVGWMDR